MPGYQSIGREPLVHGAKLAIKPCEIVSDNEKSTKHKVHEINDKHLGKMKVNKVILERVSNLQSEVSLLLGFTTMMCQFLLQFPGPLSTIHHPYLQS